MHPQLALQLYSLREQLARDFDGVMRRVAAAGYSTVETAGFAGTTPQAAARLFRELGFEVCSMHLPLLDRDKQAEVLDQLALMNCHRAVCGWVPEARFKSVDSIRGVADELNESSRLLGQHGVTLHYHNHWFELWPVGGRPGLLHLLDMLDPRVLLEVDTYWAKTGGVDPATLLAELGARAPLLHIKDGPASVEAPMVAAGDGVMDFPAVRAATRDTAEAWIVELDRCAGDMLEAVSRSYAYLSDLLAEEEQS